MLEYIPQDWQEALNNLPNPPNQWQTDLARVDNFLQTERDENRNYHPRGWNIFDAFHKTPFNSVRVVIIGQDPYPDQRDATGLAFSTHYCRSIPVSLSRIYAALAADLKGRPPTHGNLDHLAERGILLINSALTFPRIANRRNAHRERWVVFIQAVVKSLAASGRPIHFMLWGTEAKKLAEHTQAPPSRLHQTRHPAAREPAHVKEFLNYPQFSAVNTEIRESDRDEEEIDWFPPE